MYDIIINKKVKKEIDIIPYVYAKKIAHAIYNLANDPRPSRCKKLTGYEGIYRIRIGIYRVIYSIEDDILIIEVIKAGTHNQFTNKTVNNV